MGEREIIPIDATLRQVIATVLDLRIQDVRTELSMASCEKWDSLGQLNVVMAVEEAFGQQFTTSEVLEMVSYESIKRVVERSRGGGAGTAPEAAVEPPSRAAATPTESQPEVDRFADVPQVDADFLRILRFDEAFRELSSESKISLYRAHGARIGEGVVFAQGSCVAASRIVIGNHVAIGACSVLEAEQLSLGAGIRIGAGCSFVGHTIDIGAGTVVTDRVKVDVAGRGVTTAALLVIGQGCGIFDEVLLNIAQPVTLQNQVAIGPRAQIFTHSYWQSALEGYASHIRAVQLERDSWVGTGATVMPGSRVGSGSIVMPNSVVTGEVPSDTLVGGIPARPLSSGIRKELGAAEQQQVVKQIVDDFVVYLGDCGCACEPVDGTATPTYKVALPKGGTETLVLGVAVPGAVCIGFGLAETGHPALDMASLSASGPETLLSSELRNFLRRYGIRLAPADWHYDWRRGIHGIG